MSDIERLDQRLAAVERVVVDGDIAVEELADCAALAEDIERLESRLEDHERRLAALKGTTDALGGFMSNVESVNQTVERQANGAIAAVDRLEYRLDELERWIESAVETEGRIAAEEQSHDVGKSDDTTDYRSVSQGGDGDDDVKEGRPLWREPERTAESITVVEPTPLSGGESPFATDIEPTTTTPEQTADHIVAGTSDGEPGDEAQQEESVTEHTTQPKCEERSRVKAEEKGIGRAETANKETERAETAVQLADHNRSGAADEGVKRDGNTNVDTNTNTNTNANTNANANANRPVDTDRDNESTTETGILTAIRSRLS